MEIKDRGAGGGRIRSAGAWLKSPVVNSLGSNGFPWAFPTKFLRKAPKKLNSARNNHLKNPS
jgi:hypothetical protein